MIPISEFAQETIFSRTRLPTEEASTLEPDCYRRRDFFELESHKVFAHTWVCVGYSCEVDQPGKMLRAEVAGQPIVITRNKDGELRGFFNVCRHRGSVLVLEDKKQERFRCPYHSWTYDLDGKLLKCPLFTLDKDTERFDKNNYNLLPVRVSQYGCFIFVCLSEKTEALSRYLGDLPTDYKNFPLTELKLVRRKKYTIKANWKLIAENFLEYYHLPWVHPELCEVTPIEMHKRNQGAGMYMSFYASPLGKSGSFLDAGSLASMPGLNKLEQDSGYFPFVFPNLAMFLLPHHLFSLIMTPKNINETEEFGDLLVHPSVFNDPDADKKIDAIFDFYDMVNLQDILAVERVQQGIMAQAYAGGRMCYRFEEPVHRFQNMVIDFLTNKRSDFKAD